MEELKVKIKEQSSLAVQFARAASEAARNRDYVQSGQFRQQAQEAGRRCRQLIEELQEQSGTEAGKISN